MPWLTDPVRLLCAVRVLACHTWLDTGHKRTADYTPLPLPLPLLPPLFISEHHGGTASAHRGTIGVEFPVDMIRAPRTRAGPPYHRFSFAAEKEIH